MVIIHMVFLDCPKIVYQEYLAVWYDQIVPFRYMPDNMIQTFPISYQLQYHSGKMENS